MLVQITGRASCFRPPRRSPPLPLRRRSEGTGHARRAGEGTGRLVYELEREGKIEARGTVAAGETIHLGWSKWEAKVDAVLPHAELHRDMKEFPGEITPMMASSLRPGIRGHLVAKDGTRGPEEWIPSGAARELFAGQDFAWIGFGKRVVPLTYNITLEISRCRATRAPTRPRTTSVRCASTTAATGRTVRGTRA